MRLGWPMRRWRRRRGTGWTGCGRRFLSAAVDGASLALTYGEALDEGSRPASGDFTVEVGGNGRSVTGVSISGSVLTLFLNPAVEHGDMGIRVSYTVPDGGGGQPDPGCGGQRRTGAEQPVGDQHHRGPQHGA